MVQNYEDFLNTDVCKTVRYCRDILADEPIWINERVELSPINYKSKQYGSDNSMRVRMSKNSDMQKGDVVDYDGKLYLVTWQINDDIIDSHTCIMEMLASEITFKRYHDQEVDDYGNIVQDAFYEKICTCRCMHITAGNYEVRLKNSQPGLWVNDKRMITIQANPITMNIKRGDVYKFFEEIHIVRDIGYSELTYDMQHGILILYVDIIADGVALE